MSKKTDDPMFRSFEWRAEKSGLFFKVYPPVRGNCEIRIRDTSRFKDYYVTIPAPVDGVGLIMTAAEQRVEEFAAALEKDHAET